MKAIHMNYILEYDFDYSTLNQKSPTLSPYHSPKHNSSPPGESTVVQNQLTLFSASEQPSPMNIMLEPPIDVSSGKASSSSSEL